MPAPHDFWTVLQKMGPDFAMSLGFWAVCCGRGSLQTSPTWGNADAPRPSKPKPPAKPPRSRMARARGTSNERGHRAQTADGDMGARPITEHRARATSQGTVLASGTVPKPRNFFISPLACCFDVCYFLKHPRVARPASWQIGLAPIGVADATAMHRIFPYNLISDVLRVAAHASLLPICAFPIAS